MRLENNRMMAWTMIIEQMEQRGYRVIDVLGRGATSAVYLVESVAGAERHVAEKETAAGERFACKVSARIQYLELEAALLERITHPLFPRFKELWKASVHGKEEYAFLVMEYVAGTGLQEHLDRRGTFSGQKALDIALELAGGLEYLHGLNPPVFYRDLKPANMVLQQDGHARLLDVGAAAIPGHWQAGTPGYASPEQLACSTSEDTLEHFRKIPPLKPSSDVYTLGKVLEHMLTGAEPTENQARNALKRLRPRGLAHILWQATEPVPNMRIPDMCSFRREILRYYNKNSLQIMWQEIRFALRKRGPQVVYEKDVWESESRG